MRIKTNELKGAALDWAVATGLGWSEDEESWVTGDKVVPRVWGFRPSADWNQGGPLIEKWAHELLNHGIGEPWTCRAMSRYTGATKRLSGGTALIAAMRAIVASEIGDEVDVPEELL